MFTAISLEAHNPKQILDSFVYQVRQWRLDSLLYQLLEGQHAAKCQFGWYLQYQIPNEEIDQFLHALSSVQEHDPSNPYLSLVCMVQHLYGLGVPPSLEYSRVYLQQFQEHYALTSPNPNDVFLQTLAEVNHLPKLLRAQWFAAQGNGDALCDLAYYYLLEATTSQEVGHAIKLLTAAAEFKHHRALSELATLYREGNLIPTNQNKADHYARLAFLREVILYPDKPWQIKDLPIPGYAERLVERTPERIYHETLCLVNPEYDFLFAKKSSLVPLVHTPTTHGIVENLKQIVPYFIEHIIMFDKEELKSPRLKRALESLLRFIPLPKLQRDQIHLLLAYQHCIERNPTITAQHIMAIKQPYAYTEVIRMIDPEGLVGQELLTFAQQPESKAFDEGEALFDYSLIYLIASLPTAPPDIRYRLHQHLSQRYADDTQVTHPLESLAAWHIQYCQVRYALYKIQRFLNISARGWHFRHQQRKKVQAAWHAVLQELQRKQPLSPENLTVIQETYPLLTNSIDPLRHANPVVLKRAQGVSEVLLEAYS